MPHYLFLPKYPCSVVGYPTVRQLFLAMGANIGGVSRTIELKDDTVIVVLGASGDLAKKKTVCLDL